MGQKPAGRGQSGNNEPTPTCRQFFPYVFVPSGTLPDMLARSFHMLSGFLKSGRRFGLVVLAMSVFCTLGVAVFFSLFGRFHSTTVLEGDGLDGVQDWYARQTQNLAAEADDSSQLTVGHHLYEGYGIDLHALTLYLTIEEDGRRIGICRALHYRAGWPVRSICGGLYDPSDTGTFYHPYGRIIRDFKSYSFPSVNFVGKQTTDLNDWQPIWAIQINSDVVIGLRPLWLGLLLDTALMYPMFYVLLLVIRLLSRLARETKERRRLNQGCCPKCRYPLGASDRGSGSDLEHQREHDCPECGWRRPETADAGS